MYISGIFAVLLIVGVLPFTQFVVGGLFVAVCLGFAGPYIIRPA